MLRPRPTRKHLSCCGPDHISLVKWIVFQMRSGLCRSPLPPRLSLLTRRILLCPHPSKCASSTARQPAECVDSGLPVPKVARVLCQGDAVPRGVVAQTSRDAFALPVGALKAEARNPVWSCTTTAGRSRKEAEITFAAVPHNESSAALMRHSGAS